MIHIFFVPGMFGSMIEMAVKSFTDFDGNFQPIVAADGSCHTFRKDLHVFDINHLLDRSPDAAITTPIYPWRANHLDQVLDIFSNELASWPYDRKILIHAPNQMWAEINMLFQYHKIAKGAAKTLEIFGGNVNLLDIQKWNRAYTHYSEMRTWEYREWLSLFYPEFIQEWIDSPKLVSDDFVVVTNQDIIESMPSTLEKIFDHCGVKIIKPFIDFCKHYVTKQQYVLEEYRLIKNIVEHTITKQTLSWNKISIVAEAILQQQFRQRGYEWYCEGLDNLPNNSQEFQKIIFPTT